MTDADGNLFAALPQGEAAEFFSELVASENVRIERIVSYAHASPPGFWYAQETREWVVLLAGSAGLLFDGEDAPRVLKPGDYVDIPAQARHRVAWTDAAQPTVWLAVHFAR
jgi:cupin 2 domain-containing protein